LAEAVVAVLAEPVAAVQTFEVVHDVVVDDFTQSSTDGAASGTTEQTAQNGAGNDAEGGAGWTRNDETQGAAERDA
jgi:hypothetical protein